MLYISLWNNEGQEVQDGRTLTDVERIDIVFGGMKVRLRDVARHMIGCGLLSFAYLIRMAS